MTVFRNVMVYLGLGPDEQYEDGYFPEDDDGFDAPATNGREMAGSVTPGRRPTSFPTQGSEYDARSADGRLPDDDGSPSAVGAVRPLRPVIDDDEVLDLAEHERSHDSGQYEEPQRSLAGGGGGGRERSGFVRPTAPTPGAGGLGESRMDPVVRAIPIQRTKPLSIVPENFGDAKTIADEFQRSVPVIMNLQGLDRELARRLIDFASGVCYSLNGSMEKIASQVFLLTPKSVEVSDEDMRRIEERGYTR